MSVYNQAMETIKLPKKPRIYKKEQQPDQRQFSVVPIRAITDRTLTNMELRVLMMFCAYSNRGGLTWVGLQRIANHFKISMNRTAVLTRSLIAKGYMRVLYHVFSFCSACKLLILFKIWCRFASNCNDVFQLQAVVNDLPCMRSFSSESMIKNSHIPFGNEGSGQHCCSV